MCARIVQCVPRRWRLAALATVERGLLSWDERRARSLDAYHASLPASERKGQQKLTQAEFVRLRAQFGGDATAMAKYLDATFHCRTMIDRQLVSVVKRLKEDFHLQNFVETGTHDGDTSLFFSAIFDRVFTCDVRDWRRRPEFYLMDNVRYATESSIAFLRRHHRLIGARSLFFLDAHWEEHWPLRDELAFVLGECLDPVVIIDDFDVGHGLYFDEYGGQRLGFGYVEDLVPAGYKFFVNSWSNRNRGILFLFPDRVEYGCPFGERHRYSDQAHGLWGPR